jgi:hypothetical protein
MLMTMEDGGLGAVNGGESQSYIGWTQIRVIELGNLFAVNPLSISSNFVGFADGIGVLFVESDGIELKSGQVKMLCEAVRVIASNTLFPTAAGAL